MSRREQTTQRSKSGRITPQKRKYAKARARGQSMRQASRTAGLTSRRGLQGTTAAEWEREPKMQALIAAEVEKEMGDAELDGRLAAQARGEIPTKVVRGPRGVARSEYDMASGLDKIARCKGRYRDVVGGPGGGPIPHEHRFADLTDEQLRKLVAEKAAEAGLQVRGA